MPESKRVLLHVLGWLSLALLTSCAGAPPPLPTAVSQCPQFPEAPLSVLEPPQATHATDDLQSAFQEWAGSASTTPTRWPPGKSGTTAKGPP